LHTRRTAARDRLLPAFCKPMSSAGSRSELRHCRSVFFLVFYRTSSLIYGGQLPAVNHGRLSDRRTAVINSGPRSTTPTAPGTASNIMFARSTDGGRSSFIPTALTAETAGRQMSRSVTCLTHSSVIRINKKSAITLQSFRTTSAPTLHMQPHSMARKTSIMSVSVHQQRQLKQVWVTSAPAALFKRART
jgi:hypothetical protein